MNNQDDFKNLEGANKEQKEFENLEGVLKFLFFSIFIFCISFLLTDIYIIYKAPLQVTPTEHKQITPIIPNYHKQNSGEATIHSSVDTHQQYYVLFKNTEPSIKEIEMYIANNQNFLSPEKLQIIEGLRNRRITEIMAQKYLSMTKELNK